MSFFYFSHWFTVTCTCFKPFCRLVQSYIYNANKFFELLRIDLLSLYINIKIGLTLSSYEKLKSLSYFLNIGMQLGQLDFSCSCMPYFFFQASVIVKSMLHVSTYCVSQPKCQLGMQIVKKYYNFVDFYYSNR